MADASVSDMIGSALGQGGSDAPVSASGGSVGDLISAGLAGKLPDATRPHETTAKSLTLNAEAGLNDTLVATPLGGPVDLGAALINGPIRHAQMLARDIGLTHPDPKQPIIPPDTIQHPLGGSESIKSAMGLIGANPDAVVPENLAEKTARGIGAGIGGALALPLGGEALAAGDIITPATANMVRAGVGAPDALNAAIGGASGGTGTLAAEQNIVPVPDNLKPIVGMAGGLIGGAPVVAGHIAATAGKAAYDALPALTEASKDAKARASVAKEMQSAATDTSAARESLADQPHEIVPGSTGTTGQIAGDTGLLGWEGAVRQQNPEAFNSRAAEQNAARVEHLDSVQPGGNSTDLPAAVKTQRDIADKQSQAAVDQLQEQHQAELAKVKEFQPNGAPADVAAHFRDQRDALDRATQATVDRAETQAQTARDQIPSGRPEDVGANLRAPAQEARNAAKERENALWKAVDPNGELAVSMGPLQSTAKAVYGDMTKAGEAGLSPAEKTLNGVIAGFKPVESFKELTDLRSLVSSKMREELQTSGRTPAYGRMSQLRSGIENAIDGAVENRAVQQTHAVNQGQLSPEQTMAAAVQRQINEWRSAKEQAAGSDFGGEAPTASSGRTSSISGPSRTAGKGSGRSDDVAGDQGVSLTPNFDEAARDRLTAASEATKARAQTFDEGAPGKVLKPGARAGEYKASDAQVPATVFKPGPTGGEAVRSYRQAAGTGSTPALADAAAISARAAAARPDGTLDPAKLTSWAQKHASALAELPDSVRARFDNAASAESAISDAMAARRDAIEGFNKTAAAKVAGLSDEGDITRHVGSILDKKDGARQLGDLADAAKTNPAATEGLKRAVVEDVFSRFLPEEKPALDKLKTYVDDRKDVLAKVFPEKDLAALSNQIGKASEAGAKVQKGTELRQKALDQFDKGILGKVMGLDSKHDIIDTIGGIFGKSDAVRQMDTLSKTTAKTPGGSDALKKAVTEYLQQKFTGSAEAGTTGTLQLDRSTFLKFMREHEETLGKVLDDKQIGKLSAIVQDQLRANRSITATKLAGGSDTNQKLIAGGKLNAGSILSHYMMEAAGNAAGAAAGFLAGGPVGAVLGKEGGSLGAKTMAALRDAGINRLNEIRVKAALDPEFGKALLSEMPKKPDRDAAALIGLRARQWGLAGANAGATQ
jgi:hypothetical protein